MRLRTTPEGEETTVIAQRFTRTLETETIPEEITQEQKQKEVGEVSPSRKINLKPFLFVGVPAFFVLATSLYISGHSTMSNDVAAIKEMGVPSNMSELLKDVPREGASAAPYYAQFQAISAQTSMQQKSALDSIYMPNPSLSLQSPRDVAAQLKEVVKPLLEGAKQPRWTLVFNEDLLPKNELFTDANTVQTGLTLLLAIAKIESVYGNPRDAFPYLRAATAISAQVGANPGFETTAIEWESQALAEYSMIANAHPADKALGKMIADDIKRLPPLPNLRNAYTLQYWDDLKMSEDVLFGPFMYRVNPVARTRALWKRATKMQPVADVEFRMWRQAFEGMPHDPKDWSGVFASINAVTWQATDVPDGVVGIHPQIGKMWQVESLTRQSMSDSLGSRGGSVLRKPVLSSTVRTPPSYPNLAGLPPIQRGVPRVWTKGQVVILYDASVQGIASQYATIFSEPTTGNTVDKPPSGPLILSPQLISVSNGQEIHPYGIRFRYTPVPPPSQGGPVPSPR